MRLLADSHRALAHRQIDLSVQRSAAHRHPWLKYVGWKFAVLHGYFGVCT
jgi:hypothetical protein